jgi:predicted permease
MRGVQAIETIIQDVRYGGRLLRRSPGFTLLAIVSLAVGIGSGVGLFTFLNAVLLRPLPGRNTGDVYVIHTSQLEGGRYGATSYADYLSFNEASASLLDCSCATTTARANMDWGDRPQSVRAAVVSGGCFDLLRLSPHRGRLLNRSDEGNASESPIVISHALWMRHFGSDPHVVGRDVVVNGLPATIVGIAPRGFAGLSFDSGADLWATPPLAASVLPPDTLTDRRMRRFLVCVRLKEGISPAQLTAHLSPVAERLRVEDPTSWIDERGATRRVTLVRELQSRFITAPGVVPALATSVFGAISVIVALACVNLATMVMARGAARSRELSVRLALGASRQRLLRQLATESLLVAIAGTIVSVGAVATALTIFDAYRPSELPAFNLAIDWRVLAFATLVAFLAMLVFGVAPGVHAVRLAIADGLRSGSPIVRRRWLRMGARELLLVVQVTASFALLVVAALFARALMPVAERPQERSTGHIAVVPIDLDTAARSPADKRAATERLLRAADDLPGVDAATAAAVVPMTGSYIGFAGQAADMPDAPLLNFDGNIVVPGYLELTGVSVRAGRAFDARDTERAPRVAIVSEALARRFWNTTSVVGRRVRLDDRLVEVVGVVADIPYRSLSEPLHPVMYLPLAQVASNRFVLHARVRNEGEAIVELERALRSVNPRIMFGASTTLARFLDQTKAGARAAQWIGGVAGVLQLALALMATWGLVAYAVERRTSEFGVRLALGATPAAIVQLVMRPSLLLLAAGVVMGGLGGVVASRVLESEFLGLAPVTWTAMIPLALIFAAVAATAAWVPARRAGTIEPAAALRQN